MNAGKGDSSRPYTNYKQYLSNFDEIEWREKKEYCFNCGATIDNNLILTKPELFDMFEDGSICHKNGCNFN